MDGKRGIRPQGTDGSDFKFRQEIAGKYAAMAQVCFIESPSPICLDNLCAILLAQNMLLALIVLLFPNLLLLSPSAKSNLVNYV